MKVTRSQIRSIIREMYKDVLYEGVKGRMPQKVADAVLASLASERGKLDHSWPGEHKISFTWDVNKENPDDTSAIGIESTEWDSNIVVCGGDQTHTGEICRPADVSEIDDDVWRNVREQVTDAVDGVWAGMSSGERAKMPTAVYSLQYSVGS